MVEHLSVGLDREIEVREEESLMFDETEILRISVSGRRVLAASFAPHLTTCWGTD